MVPYEVQEVLAPGSTIADTLQSRVSLWGVHVLLGDALLVSAQARRDLLHICIAQHIWLPLLQVCLLSRWQHPDEICCDAGPQPLRGDTGCWVVGVMSG